jgi:ribosomal peptide maturation radical SAM protein 1
VKVEARVSEVALVSMPFGPLFSPSIGLSLLKSGLARVGIQSRVHYFTIRFAELTGSRFYLDIANGVRPSVVKLAGEWIFSAALFDDTRDRGEAYVDTVLRRRPGKTNVKRRRTDTALIARILRAREIAGGFVRECAEELMRDEPAIVGLTSVFQQQTASLALARCIKSIRPQTVILFGGANCEGVMGAEMVRRFPFVDAAVSGEGDGVVPELVRRILDGRSIDELPGVRTRATSDRDFAEGRFGNAPTVLAMDDLPYPDYDDYFADFKRSHFQRRWQPRIFFETSRGCWWGEKMHCTFCGLNGATMQFRSKSAGRATAELTHLTDRHPGCDVEMTDNILDLAYFRDFIPEMARRKIDLDIFYETKSNLRKEQVRMLAAAGIRSIQPGIESLSDPVLKLMRKGVTALQNIQLLKWCKQFGVTPRWNILWGFPGEPAEAYARMAALAPSLTHLQPPSFFSTIRLDRFSPNFFEAEKLGFAAVEPLDAYQYIYSHLPREAIRNLAYHFKFEYRQPQDLASYARPLALALRDWQASSGRSDLFSIDNGEHLIIWDLRPVARRALTVLTGAERLLYLACDAVADVRQLAAALGGSGLPLGIGEIASMLVPFVENALIVQDEARYLALAVPVGNEYAPAQPVVKHFYGMLRTIGDATPDGIAVPWRGAPRKLRSGHFPRVHPRVLSAPQFKVDGAYVLIR